MVNRKKIEIRIDEKDVKIINLLSKNSRSPLKEIAREIEMSEPGVRKRLERLRKTGVIREFTCKIDFPKLGFGMSFYSMASVSDANYSVEAASEIIKIPEVTLTDIVTGEYDIILRGTVTGQEHLFSVLSRIQSIKNVNHLFTMVVINTFDEKLDPSALLKNIL